MKRDAKGQQVWRTAVRAFREASVTLVNPAPHAFSLLSTESAFTWLTAELPLAYFSPFSALPSAADATRDEFLEGRADKANRRLNIYERPAKSREKARASLNTQSSPFPLKRHESPSPVAPEAHQRLTTSPVFSLKPRRSSNAQVLTADDLRRQRQSSPIAEARQETGRTLQVDSHEEKRDASDIRKHSGAIALAPQLAEATTTKKQEALRRSLAAEPLHEEVWSGVEDSTALSLLNNLADETLQSMRRREAEPLLAENSSARAPQERTLQYQPRATINPATTHTAALTREEVNLSASPLVKAQTLLQLDDERTAGISGRSIEMIHVLAEQLLARSSAPALPVREHETAAKGVTARSQPLGQVGVADSSRSHASEDLFSSPVSALVAGPEQTDKVATSRVASEPSHAVEGETSLQQPLDAEAVASLVNDILVEQARRHGVDLS